MFSPVVGSPSCRWFVRYACYAWLVRRAKTKGNTL